ncbi:MAG: HlyD family efflux transporter periplasmic adaptor subunit [Pleurocapsa sp. MO_226.B13]|nr:HlyD family efflux transporter periplasmic adaptor subunit [Pleurocapsa sp. MO_226.B13]
MNNDTKITISEHQELFVEANNNLHLKQLYNRIETIKIQQQQQPLTDLEKVCLRGLLCGYTPDKIAQKLVEELDPFLIHVTFWTLFRYIQIMAGREEERITNYQDIISSLEASGYKTDNADTILINGNEQKNFPSDLIRAEVKPNLEESLTENANNTALVPQSQTDTLNHQPRQNILTQVDENDFMPAISPWTRLGGLFLVGSVGIAIALSAFTPYKVTVKAEAKVRPTGELRIVEAKTEGTVVEINVEENQPIKRGDIIATIDSSRLETEKSQRQSQIQQSKLQLGQINAQIRTLERQIQAEKDRTQRAIEVATVELSRSRREYQDRQITSQAEVAEAEANVKLAEEEWQQAQAELISAQANLKSNQAVLASARSRRDRYQIISATGALSQNQLEEAQLEVEQQQQQVAAQKATVEQQKRGIARQKQAVAAAKARLNNVRAALNPNGGEVAIATQRIAQERASGEAAAAALYREQEAMIQQRIELEQQLARDLRELKQIDKDIEQTVIKAPDNGVLFQLSLRNPSQTVQPGSEIARIAPDESSLALEALVSSNDISSVKMGQKAQVRISACPYPDYGTLKGVVNKISPDAISLESNSNGANLRQTLPAAYKIEVEPKHLTLSQGKNKCALQVGMEGRAYIIAKEETLLKFLLRKARLLTNL